MSNIFFQPFVHRVLKPDLFIYSDNKREVIFSAEQDNTQLSSQHETLKRQVSLMQQRLSQSQGELQRLQTGDIYAQFKVVEQERDVLLDFVQGICTCAACVCVLVFVCLHTYEQYGA